MNQTQKTSGVPGILLIAGSFIGVLLWLVMLFYAFFLGGSPGPDYERTVPLAYVNIICFGFIGAIVGLVAGVKSMRGVKTSTYVMIIITALLGITGSVPLFLLDLAPVGIFYGLVGIMPSALYFLLTRLLGGIKRN